MDWSGTIVDHGCLAPTAVFQEIFHQKGVEISRDIANGPMGMYKRDHIRAILAENPSVAADWKAANGHAWTEADVDELFVAYTPMQVAVLDQYDDIIPGAIETIEALRGRSIKIGGSTGFPRPALNRYAEIARAKGLELDQAFCPDDVPQGRPAPWMIYENMKATGVFPASLVVKVGDTVADIQEGTSAGVWTVGVVASSVLVGLPKTEFDDLPGLDRDTRLAAARNALRLAGAHYTINTIADLPNIITEIDARLARGEEPACCKNRNDYLLLTPAPSRPRRR